MAHASFYIILLAREMEHWTIPEHHRVYRVYIYIYMSEFMKTVSTL